MTRLFFLIIAFLWSSSAFATVYYVDYVGGADTNNGTDTGTPFKHCPGDTAATSNAAALTPAAGDYIVFKGGVTYPFTAGGYITIKSSGSAGSGDVTYISGHVYSPQWGTSRAAIDGANSGINNYGILDVTSKNYITIKGLEMVNQPTNGEGNAFIGAENSAPVWSHITIDNCYMHNTNGNAIYMRGLYDSGATHPSYLVVENSDFEDSYAHLLQISWGIDHTTIINNYFKNFGSDPYSAGGPLANAIILSGTMDQSNWTISRNYDTLISGNEFYAQVNGKKSIILFQNNCQSLTVEENYFHGTPNVSVIDHTAPQTNYTIRNNIFAAYPVWLEGILRFWTDQGFTITSDAIHIYNNTFVGTPALEAIMYFYKGDSPADTSFTNLDIRNNIIDTDANDKDLIHISNNAAATGPVVQMSTFTCDYNRYNAGTNATPFWYRGTNYSLTNWKSTIQAAGATGADNHSAMGTVTFTSRATLDFTLSASDTVATGNGVDLSASFTTALISPKLFPTPNTGTRSAPWDIGAYKAGSGGDSPVNITGQGGTGGAATLTVTGYQVTTLAPTVTSTVVHFQ